MSLHRRILLSPYPNGPDVSWSSPLPDLAPPALSARHLSNAAIASVSAAVAAAFLALVYYSVLRRRRRRRGDYPAGSVGGDDTASNSDGGDASDDYHVWNIQTVGLNDSAITSIGSYAYLPGGGGNLTADCTVCLGQFEGGEMVRLLPKCGHVFHVPCIDTWLKAHVSCPLCRALVLSPEEDPGRVPAGPEEEGEGGSDNRVRVLADPDAPLEAEEAPEIPMDRSADTEREERSGEERKEENLGEREIGVSSSSGSGRGFFVKLGRGRSSSVLPFPF